VAARQFLNREFNGVGAKPGRMDSQVWLAAPFLEAPHGTVGDQSMKGQSVSHHSLTERLGEGTVFVILQKGEFEKWRTLIACMLVCHCALVLSSVFPGEMAVRNPPSSSHISHIFP